MTAHHRRSDSDRHRRARCGVIARRKPPNNASSRFCADAGAGAGSSVTNKRGQCRNGEEFPVTQRHRQPESRRAPFIRECRSPTNASDIGKVASNAGPGTLRHGYCGSSIGLAGKRLDNHRRRKMPAQLLEEFRRLVQRPEIAARPRGRCRSAPSSRSTMVSTITISAPELTHRVHRLDRRAAGRGDVLDDHHALAGQRLAGRQPLDRQTRAMLLRLLAHEERLDRLRRA